MLDLQPRIHLHKIKPPTGLNNKFNRARTNIIHCPRGRDRGVSHRTAALLSHAWGRRLFDHLLMAALHRAIALKQVHAVALRITKHLNLDMTRLLHITLDQHAVIVKARGRFTFTRSESGCKVLRTRHYAHPFTAAAGARLDHDGVTKQVCLLL